MVNFLQKLLTVPFLITEALKGTLVAQMVTKTVIDIAIRKEH